jgi:hypothetical protein
VVGELVADLEGREVRYDFGELDALVLAYATDDPQGVGLGVPAGQTHEISRLKATLDREVSTTRGKRS